MCIFLYSCSNRHLKLSHLTVCDIVGRMKNRKALRVFETTGLKVKRSANFMVLVSQISRIFLHSPSPEVLVYHHATFFNNYHRLINYTSYTYFFSMYRLPFTFLWIQLSDFSQYIYPVIFKMRYYLHLSLICFPPDHLWFLPH